MAEVAWPASAEVHAAVAERLVRLLDEVGGAVAQQGRRALAQGNLVLSAQPHSARTVIVPGACVAAGGDWRQALWPAVASECLMAAADLFDDAADADTAGDVHPGVLLTAAAGLLSLAPAAATRVVDDGASDATAVALVRILGDEFTRAANGQALNLRAPERADPLAAYEQAAAKSGPLGALMARLGARTATSDAGVIDLLGEFGRRLAVRDQLINDLRDAAPDPSQPKSDVRSGAHTVPLAFTGSRGAPSQLSDLELEQWEAEERVRIASSGGLAAAYALAEAERVRIEALLATLASLGKPVDGLRAIV